MAARSDICSSIPERYGLFTIIVLGECVLAATSAVDAAVHSGGVTLGLVTLAIGGLVLVFAMWWAYFKHRSGIDEQMSLRAAIAWGYGHYFVFAAVAAMGAGLQVAADAILDEADVGSVVVALTVAVPVVIYLVTVALLHGVSLGTRLGIPSWSPRPPSCWRRSAQRGSACRWRSSRSRSSRQAWSRPTWPRWPGRPARPT
ncbi:MAG: low temperature requirement protein A [Candidatus Limnocylindrales bacterium]